MTAEELINEIDKIAPNKQVKNWLFHTNQFKTVENLMKMYAKLKCKEFLEIAAEKAKVYNKKDGESDKYLSIEGDWIYVSKNSILNTVDLKEFIK